MQRALARRGLVDGGRLDRVERVERVSEAGDVEQARDRAAPATALVALGDLAAAVDALDPAAIAQQPGAIDRRHRPHQALLFQELRERLVGAVAARALQLRRAAPARLVVDEPELAVAARAARVGAQHLVRQRARRRHVADQLEQRRAAQLRGLGAVEPDQVAAAAEVEVDAVPVVAGERQPLHRLAAVAADERRLGRRGNRAHPRLGGDAARHAPAGRRGSSSAPARRRRRA